MYIKLAWRNLWRNYRRTLITVSSIMFAVVFALFLESIGRGSHNMMIDNMTRFHTGYMQLQDYRYQDEPSLDNAFYYDNALSERVDEIAPDIDFTLPRIEAFMLAAGEEQTRGALVLGVDLSAENRLNELEDRLSEGRFFEPGDGTAVLAEGLAGRLNLSVGDTLVLLGQGRYGMTAAGAFEISGFMSHPAREMNNQMVYLSLADAQWLLAAEDHITSLLVIPEEVGDTEHVAGTLQAEFGGGDFRILTWQELMPELLEAIEFDQASSRVYMIVLYVVIGFGIFGTILTMTLERMREFGILLSVGMHRWRLSLVVFIETFFISILGLLSGYVLGFFVLLYFNYNPIEFSGDGAEVIMSYGIEPVIPTALAADIFLLQGVIVFLLTTVICLYPSLKIFRLKIIDAARS